MLNTNRFAALDAWRGLCATMVVLYHFMAFSHLTFLPIIRHAYLFVDFFFVLSGFIIANGYYEKLCSGFGIRHFLFLRLGRVYPLHLATMIAFLPFLVVRVGVSQEFWQSLASNAFLMHGLGVLPIGVKTLGGLNFPSWSISAECAAYVVFALCATLPRRIFLLALAAGAIVCPWIIVNNSPAIMNATFDYGFIRCLYGFSLGMLCFFAYDRLHFLQTLGGRIVTSLFEIASIATALWLITIFDDKDPATIIVPVVFSVIVLIFARQSGCVSQLLLCRPWQEIGKYSYSIYMVHVFVQIFMKGAAFGAQRFGHVSLFSSTLIEGTKQDLLGTAPWQGDLATLMMLAATISLAALTFRFIEEPARLLSRRAMRQSLSKAEERNSSDVGVGTRLQERMLALRLRRE